MSLHYFNIHSPPHSAWPLAPSLVASSHLTCGGPAPARLTSLPSDGCSRAPSDGRATTACERDKVTVLALFQYILTKVPSRSPPSLGASTTLRPLTFTSSQLMATLPVVAQPPSDGCGGPRPVRRPRHHRMGAGQCKCLCINYFNTLIHQGLIIPSHSPWLLPPSLGDSTHLASDDGYRPSGGSAPRPAHLPPVRRMQPRPVRRPRHHRI